MKPYRRLLRSRHVQRPLAAGLTAYVRLAHRTTRWKRRGDDIVDRLLADRTPVILCYWHGRLLMLAPGWRYPDRTHLLISSHADGDLIASIVNRLGFGTVRGSSSRGGTGAFRQMLRLLRDGVMIGITPDGPRGPRMRASEGAIALAKVSGAALLPVAYSTSGRHVAPSWDRFIVPRPFTRGAYLIGEPIRIGRDAGPEAIEAARRSLETALTALTDEADLLCGQATIPAAPEEPGYRERADTRAAE